MASNLATAIENEKKRINVAMGINNNIANRMQPAEKTKAQQPAAEAVNPFAQQQKSMEAVVAKGFAPQGVQLLTQKAPAQQATPITIKNNTPAAQAKQLSNALVASGPSATDMPQQTNTPNGGQEQQTAGGIRKVGANSFTNRADSTLMTNTPDARGIKNVLNNTPEFQAKTPQPQPQSIGFNPAQAQDFRSPSEKAAAKQQLIDQISKPIPGSRGGALTANQVRALVDVQNQDAQLEAQQSIANANNMSAAQRQAMQNQAELQRTQMAQEGENARLGLRTKAEMDQFNQKFGLESKVANTEMQAKGFEVAKAQRLQKLQQQFDAAKTDEERAQIRNLAAGLEAKPQAQTQGNFGFIRGEETIGADGKTVRSPDLIINKDTGAVRPADIGQTATAQADMPKFEKGKIYVDANSNRVTYDGTNFVPVNEALAN